MDDDDSDQIPALGAGELLFVTEDDKRMVDDVGLLVDDAFHQVKLCDQDLFVVSVKGNFYAFGGEEEVAYVFNRAHSDAEVIFGVKHEDSVTFLGFNMDCTLFASGDMAGHIFITRMADCDRAAQIDDCSDMKFMFWHTSLSILFAGDASGTLFMWLITHEGVANTKFFSAGDPECVAGCFVDSSHVCVAYNNGIVRLWDLKANVNISLNLNVEIEGVIFNAARGLFAVSSANGDVFILRPTDSNLEILYTHRGGESTADDDVVQNSVESMQFCPDLPLIAFGLTNGFVHVLQIGEYVERWNFNEEENTPVVKLLWHGTTLIVAYYDGVIRFYDVRNGKMKKQLLCARDNIYDIVFADGPDGQPILVVACSKGTVRYFNVLN